MNEKKTGMGSQIVFLAKKNIDIKEVSFKNIKEDMIKILEKIGQEY